MKKFITFEEAIRKHIIEERDKVNPHKLYSENKIITLLPEEIGWEESQIFNREEDLNFFYAENRDGIPTLWGDITKTRLGLYGEIGAVRGVQSVNSSVMPYSNLRMGMVASALNEDAWCNVPDIDKVERYCKMSWLATFSCMDIIDEFDDVGFGLRCMYGSNVGNYCLFDQNGNEYKGYYGFCPAVSIYLPSKILVDIEESKKQETWILVPNKNY